MHVFPQEDTVMPFSRRFFAVVILTICLIAIIGGCGTVPEIREFSFIIISDVHIPTYGFPIGLSLDEENLMEMHNQKRLVEFTEECLSIEPKPHFVVNAGDTGDAGWKPFLKLYCKLIQPVVSAGIPVYTVVGNHDHDYAGIGREDLAEFFDPLGPSDIGCSGSRYSFDYGGCHLIVMNNRPISGLIRFNPKDIAWLKNDLDTVNKDTRVFLFMHANMQEEDTHHIVELLQPFKYPVIFQGHRHSAGMDRWGRVPVVLTGSLYGGTPEAGSYSVVNVHEEGITVRTRDFAETFGTFGPEEAVEFLETGPVLAIAEPDNTVLDAGGTITVETDSDVQGVLDYRIPGLDDWMQAVNENGKWIIPAPSPETPGRYFLAVRYTGDNGSVVLAHRDIVIPGNTVRQSWSVFLGSGIQGAPVLYRDLAIIPTIEGGVFALKLSDGEEVWHCDVPEGQILGRMAIEGSTVFFGAGRTIKACDAATGKLMWEKSLEGTVIAGITTAGGRLFVPAGENNLYCLDSGDGRILWDYPVRLPVIMEAATDSDRVCFGAMDGCIRALDAATGDELWKNQWSPQEDRYTTAPFWPPVVTSTMVIAGKNPVDNDVKNLAAFDAASGAMLWSGIVSAGTFRSALDPSKNKLFISTREGRQNGIQCISVKDGSVLWSRGTNVAMNAAVATGNLVFERDAYHLCCLNAENGALLWKYRTNTGPQGSYYGPAAFAVTDDTAVVGTMGGHVLALTW